MINIFVTHLCMLSSHHPIMEYFPAGKLWTLEQSFFLIHFRPSNFGGCRFTHVQHRIPHDNRERICYISRILCADQMFHQWPNLFISLNGFIRFSWSTYWSDQYSLIQEQNWWDIPRCGTQFYSWFLSVALNSLGSVSGHLELSLASRLYTDLLSIGWFSRMNAIFAFRPPSKMN